MKSSFILKSIIVLFASAVLLGSCSKAVKLEKRLDGTWNIDSWTTVESTNGTAEPAETRNNAGTFVFMNEKGTNTGTMTLTEGSFTFTFPITSWTNTADVVTINYTVDFLGTTSNETDVWTVVSNSKSSQEWVMTEEETDSNGDKIKTVYTAKLSKK